MCVCVCVCVCGWLGVFTDDDHAYFFYVNRVGF